MLMIPMMDIKMNLKIVIKMKRNTHKINDSLDCKDAVLNRTTDWS